MRAPETPVLATPTLIYDKTIGPSEKLTYLIFKNVIEEQGGKTSITDIDLAILRNVTKQRAYQLTLELERLGLIGIKYENFKNRVITLKYPAL